MAQIALALVVALVKIHVEVAHVVQILVLMDALVHVLNLVQVDVAQIALALVVTLVRVHVVVDAVGDVEQTPVQQILVLAPVVEIVENHALQAVEVLVVLHVVKVAQEHVVVIAKQYVELLRAPVHVPVLVLVMDVLNLVQVDVVHLVQVPVELVALQLVEEAVNLKRVLPTVAMLAVVHVQTKHVVVDALVAQTTVVVTVVAQGAVEAVDKIAQGHVQHPVLFSVLQVVAMFVLTMVAHQDVEVDAPHVVMEVAHLQVRVVQEVPVTLVVETAQAGVPVVREVQFNSKGNKKHVQYR